MKICAEFWDEFMHWAIPMRKVKPDADIYDVFEWIRSNQQGAMPYSENFLATIDLQIEKEIARDEKRSRKMDGGN